MNTKVQFPFPYFGNKSRCAPVVWGLLGDLKAYTEPFCGSMANLLLRPPSENNQPTETVNDLSGLLVNAWRAIQLKPGATAAHCILPVSEIDLEARHNHLVQLDPEDMRNRLGDPEYCDPKLAAWYIWGSCSWIGGGWCSGEGPWKWTPAEGWFKQEGTGVNRVLPHTGTGGQGVNRKLPHTGDGGQGVNRMLPHTSTGGQGVNRMLPRTGDEGEGQYQDRVKWVTGWFQGLSDRLCHTRITCGDWRRVMGNTVRHAARGNPHGVFLDPPYDGTEYVYGKSTAPVSQQVREWCVEHTDDPGIRIVLAGRGDEHDALMDLGWRRVVWTGIKGYSNKKDHEQEVLWSSPGCLELPTQEEPEVTQ